MRSAAVVYAQGGAVTDQRIWPATDGPATSGSDGQPINVGTEFFVTTSAWAVALRWYRGTLLVQPTNLRLYQITSSTAGTVLSEVISPGVSGLGWQESPISPVALMMGVRYKVVARMPDHYTATSGYWTSGPGSGGIVNGFLTAPDTTNADGGGQGTFRYGVVAFPDGSFNGGNYWVDIVVTDVDPTAAPGTTLRERVSGFEPLRVARGYEPINQVTGQEVGA